jgi:endonuclease YncB( thermonuclease family)
MKKVCANTTRWFLYRLAASALAGILALALVLAIPAPETSARSTPERPVRVIDGDTLDVGGERVRLEGIDAPELAQTCPRRLVGTWDCGRAAAQELRRQVQGRDLDCQPRGTDKYGRTLGVCYIAGRDVNALMVRHGFAWAFRKYSLSYMREEEAARAEHAGIWQAEAEPAWEYRRKRWAGAETAAPEGCAIKGNVSANGRIYHTPWSPWYARVSIDESRGERWFCSEAEALSAGWRPVGAP